MFNPAGLRGGTRRLWLVCEAEADNLIGRYPNEQGRDHTAQPDGSRESRPGPTKASVPVDVADRPGDDSGDLRNYFRRRSVCFNDCGSAAAGEPRGAWSHRGSVPSNPTKPAATSFAHSVTDLSSSRHGYGGSAYSALVSTPKHRNRNFGTDRDCD